MTKIKDNNFTYIYTSYTSCQIANSLAKSTLNVLIQVRVGGELKIHGNSNY